MDQKRILPLVLALCAAPSAMAQTTVNPDISVIPRFRVETSDDAARSFGTPRIMMEEVEVAIQGYVNPYARADVFLAKPGGDEPLEIEEANATILRGLPFDLNLKLGKSLLEFGKNNTLHPHAWAYLDRPLSAERFLGEEGLGGVGVSSSVLLPTGEIYSRWNIDLFDASDLLSVDPTAASRAGGVGLIDTIATTTRWGIASRLTAFFPVGEFSDLEVGLSGLSGIHDPYAGHRFWYGNVEFKYKWKPDSYTSWTIQGEGLFNARTIRSAGGSADVESAGWFLLADHQFQKVYSSGIRLDWSQSPYASDDRAWGGVVWFGYYPVEETLAFRLQWRHTITESPWASRTSVNTLALQVLFSLGPHRAHPF